MRRFTPGLIATGILSLVVSNIVGAGDGRKNAAKGGASKSASAGSCHQQSPVIDKGGTCPGDTQAGTIEEGSGGQGGADEILVDDQGKVDDEILVDDAQNQPGLRRAGTSSGHVLVNNGAKDFKFSRLQVHRNNGETKFVPGIRLRSASGKPLTLEQFRVKTASGELKTVQGIRARTSSGKTTILPVRQLQTSDGKLVTFVSPPRGSNLRVTHPSASDRQGTSTDNP